MTKKATDGAFQHYATVKSILVSVIPDSLPLANGAVLPLAIGTAAAGLYSVLKLPLPSLNPVPNGKTLLIWGGSSSVGSATIQLAIASGFKVISTASPKNFDYVKSLGATTVLDYGQENIVEQIFSALEGETLAGVFDAIGAETSARASAAVVSKYGGGKLALALWAPEGLPENVDAELGKCYSQVPHIFVLPLMLIYIQFLVWILVLKTSTLVRQSGENMCLKLWQKESFGLCQDQRLLRVAWRRSSTLSI